jgi:hypothetical protein
MLNTICSSQGLILRAIAAFSTTDSIDASRGSKPPLKPRVYSVARNTPSRRNRFANRALKTVLFGSR